MSGDELRLTIDIELEADTDAAELDTATLQLREELLELDVDDVKRPVGGPVPPGTRAVEAAVLGTLLVTTSREVVAAVLRTIGGWIARRPCRSVKLRIGDDAIEITDASDDQQRELIESFLARHAAAAS
jgi:hypothetical protein